LPTADQLIAGCREGDELAWEALVRRYQGRVFGVAIHYLRDREEARDVAQEVFVKVYRSLDSVREGDTFLAWLLRLTRNQSIDRLRRLTARRTDRAVPVEEAAQLPDPAPGPESDGLGGERRRLLYRALGQLSPLNREMILLKDIQELKLVEIADLLDVPVGTVKTRSHRARLELAQAIRSLGAATSGGGGAA